MKIVDAQKKKKRNRGKLIVRLASYYFAGQYVTRSLGTSRRDDFIQDSVSSRQATIASSPEAVRMSVFPVPDC
jgi:hypothetical protein